MTMTLQEKLDFIDSEIRKIHKFCTKSGYSDSQIEDLAKPFFNRDGHHFSTTLWASGKAWKRRIIALIVLVVAIYLLFKYDPAYNLLCVVTRLGAIQILPLWDWTQIYHTHCWVQNPLYKSKLDLQVSDCQICEAIEGVTRAKELENDDLITYLNRDLILLIVDGNLNWENASNMTIQQLSEIYTHDPVMNQYYSCNFNSNIRTKNSDHMELFLMFKSGKLDKFYALWENCNALAARSFRKFYKRPYFVSRAITLTQSNWLFIAANYTSKLYKPVNVTDKVLIFMQVKGDSFVRFRAKEPCLEICHEFENTLFQGEIVALNTFIWNMEYIPSNSPENIAIAMGASYN